jgi:hypothetical protein
MSTGAQRALHKLCKAVPDAGIQHSFAYTIVVFATEIDLGKQSSSHRVAQMSAVLQPLVTLACHCPRVHS